MPEASSEPPVVADPLPSGVSPFTATEAQRQGRRAQRTNRYEEVIKLHQQGASQVAIATLVGLRSMVFACNPQKLRLTQVFKLDHVRRSGFRCRVMRSSPS